MSIGQEVVAAHVNNPVSQKESRVCYEYGKSGHIRAQCRTTSYSGCGVKNSAVHPRNDYGEEVACCWF